ncbi:hypothetical protein E2562_029840 [Oryza meyeriana var. granulata]|uniref:DUF1995 domain-containing protein n=1 Tax=Oryza meyeriana var. granulata TaxID=110450 RepID=A0A6G1ER34_9ORYZ|nr:hypothetical protein E2562_029840 [Oryza meyeriana var. granulata]
MALSLLNSPTSKLAPKPPLPPPSRQFAPPQQQQKQSPLHLSLLLREQPRHVRSSSSPPVDASPSPPSSREEAVSQARSCLATALRKPLNNSVPPRKLKKQRQPRFRAEIPVVDDSPGSLARLASDVFSSGLGVSRKGGGAPARLLLVWPSSEELGVALQGPYDWGTSTAHAQLDAVAPDALSSCDAAVFLAPGRSQVEKMRAAADALDPKPVVLFNPAWSFDEEEGFAVSESGFVCSFNVVYSFTGLEVRGLLSKKRGVLLRCVEGGRFGGESWVLMVEDDAAPEVDQFKVVSRLKRRPTIGEVETMLYNLMAANSPVTKSARFLRQLVSNVTGGKNEKQ